MVGGVAGGLGLGIRGFEAVGGGKWTGPAGENWTQVYQNWARGRTRQKDDGKKSGEPSRAGETPQTLLRSRLRRVDSSFAGPSEGGDATNAEKHKGSLTPDPANGRK
jgi:hypothetical protein